jgi:hypothetical protein
MIAVASACGARTELEVGLPADASGGGGAGGEGGAPPPSCVLTQLPGEIVLAGGEAFAQRAPSLQELVDDVFLMRLATQDGAGDQLGRAVFSWDDAWPPAVPFAAQPGPFCRSYVSYSGLALIAGLEGTPFLASASSEEPWLQLAVGEGTPAFFDAASPTMFGAFTIAADSQLYLVVVAADLDFDFRLDWGCGSTPVRADAIPWQGDGNYLVALTSGADFGGCGIPGGAGPSTRLQIARFDTSFEGELLYETDLGRSAHSLKLAPREGGAWLAVRRDGEGTATTIDVYRLDANGAPIADPTTIDPHGPVGESVFDASPMGDRLVVSYRDDVTNRLTIQIVESDGRLGANAVLQGADNGESSVLGKDDSVLLAYTTPGTPSQVRVARFECLAP